MIGNGRLIAVLDANVLYPAPLRDFLLRLAQTPDTFISELASHDLLKVMEALNNLINALKKPPQSKDQVLQTLASVGLSATVGIIKKAQ